MIEATMPLTEKTNAPPSPADRPCKFRNAAEHCEGPLGEVSGDERHEPTFTACHRHTTEYALTQPRKDGAGMVSRVLVMSEAIGARLRLFYSRQREERERAEAARRQAEMLLRDRLDAAEAEIKRLRTWKGVLGTVLYLLGRLARKGGS